MRNAWILLLLGSAASLNAKGSSDFPACELLFGEPFPLAAGKSYSSGPDRPSLRLTSKLPDRNLSSTRFLNLKDYRKLHGKIFSNGWEGDHVEFLFPEDLSAEESRLARYLREKSVSPAFAAGSEVGSVEVGAWRIEFKNGQVLELPHTSRKSHGILNDDSEGAIERNLKDRGLFNDGIALVQYFHSHPDIPMLSGPDVQSARKMKTALREAGIQAPVHEYSVGASSDGHVVLGHFGVD